MGRSGMGDRLQIVPMHPVVVVDHGDEVGIDCR